MRIPALLIAIALWYPGTAPAAAPGPVDQPPLFRVELVVFANITPGAGTEESWPQPQGLAYPERWKILDAESRQALEDLLAEDPAASPSPAAAETETAAPAPSPAWRSLPDESWQLADSAARLERSGRYRVLLHQAWLQPLEGRQHSPAVVLAGGEQFGDHHELEGYLRLSQERFIHADAEFWLSRFRFGSGLEATLFSPLPLPPQHQAALHRNWFGDASRDPLGTGFGQAGGTFEHQYVASQIFVLQRKQRMEPGQLTYLDHPLIGALLLVAPVEEAATRESGEGRRES